MQLLTAFLCASFVLFTDLSACKGLKDTLLFCAVMNKTADLLLRMVRIVS
jgi:hypothetical protein